MSIQEVTAVTPENLAKFRALLREKGDGELEMLARHSDNAAGAAAAILLAERHEAKAKEAARIATVRHTALLREIATPTLVANARLWVSVIGAIAGLSPRQTALPLPEQYPLPLFCARTAVLSRMESLVLMTLNPSA